MAKKPTNFHDGIKLVPETSATPSEEGELKYDETSGKLKLKGASLVDSVVEEAKTQTLTNKTLTTPVINSPTGLVKADVGLSNVDNTSDATKNAASVTLTNKTLTAPVINSPTGIVKADVGLGNVDNTSDATKNAASVTLTNKTLTAPVINSPTGLVKADVGLGNVDNTSDATKNAASATLTNKTLTGNIAVNLVSGSATVTLPTTTSTLSTLALSETLTNKTLTSPIVNTPTIDVAVWDDQTTPSNPSSGFFKTYFKSDGKLYKLNSAGTEVEIGSGGAGGINYIQQNGGNHDAESGTTGWVVSKNTSAAAAPDSGFVTGSTNITWTRTTSTPLRGAGSFLLTKGGSTSRRGEQVYYPFTIDTTDQAKMMSISFDYQIASGTYADGDVVVYIYDVTNGTFIQPVNYSVSKLGSTTTYGRHSATFQTASNSTSYRILLHVASTSASDYTIKVDNVSVGPQSLIYGAPITDWTTFTPTGDWTGVTYTGQWRRVGDSMEVNVNIALTGAPTGTDLKVNLPAGYTIDTSKLAGTATVNNVVVGQAIFQDNGIATYNGTVVYFSTTQVWAVAQVTTGTFAFQNGGSSTVPFTFGNLDQVGMTFKVPIVGWSTSVAMSAATPTVNAPTVQKFTVTGTGTYTTPSNPTPAFIRVRMVGGGGGGQGSNGSGATAGAASYFRVGASPDLLVANGGSAGGTNAGGAGGSASLGSGPIGLALTGGTGTSTMTVVNAPGGTGGSSAFGGAGGGGIGSGSGAQTAGAAGAANTGSGGGGGGGAASTTSGAGGGGAGGYVDAIITSPGTTYAYNVGTGGTAGTGSTGANGGAGAAGIIIVEEYYRPLDGTIGTTETVAAEVTGSSTTINNTNVALVPTSIVVNTHGSFSGSTFTCPVAGLYQVGGFLFSGHVTWAADYSMQLKVYKNGSSYRTIGAGRIEVGRTESMMCSGSTIVRCLAGDTLQLYGFADASNTVSDFNGYFVKIGNY